jgi:hypothetical protein
MGPAKLTIRGICVPLYSVRNDSEDVTFSGIEPASRNGALSENIFRFRNV